MIVAASIAVVGASSKKRRAKARGLAEPPGLGHRAARHVQRDVQPLPRQLASHARPAAGNDGDPAREILHAVSSIFSKPDESASGP